MDTFVFYFFYHECLVRVLMRPSFAGSFSLIFHRFHLLNAKKKETSRKFSLSKWWYFRQAKSYKFIVVVNEKRQVLTWEFLRRGVHHSVDIQIRLSKVTVIFTGNVTKNWFIIWLKAVLRKNIDSSLAKVDWAFLPCTFVIDVKKCW